MWFYLIWDLPLYLSDKCNEKITIIDNMYQTSGNLLLLLFYLDNLLLLPFLLQGNFNLLLLQGHQLLLLLLLHLLCYIDFHNGTECYKFRKS